MRGRTWPVLTLGFGALLALVLIFAGSAVTRARHLERSLQELTDDAQRNNQNITGVRVQVYLSGLILRDYLLEESEARRVHYQQRIHDVREAVDSHIRELDVIVDGQGDGTVDSLRAALNAYWKATEQVFALTPAQKQSAGAEFLSRNVIPHRNAVVALADEIARLSTASFDTQQQGLEANFGRFYSSLQELILVIGLLGAAVAAIATLRVAVLERRSSSQHARTERAEHEMRLLSHQLVRAQEEERRAISRELHDEVGQVLTGLRVGLANLERSYGAREAFNARLEECRAVLDRTIAGVRELAMGLRPSMLDDAGLGAALEWQAREFSRQYDTPVTVTIGAAVDELSEVQRASIYRVVQEALTNCARHAEAKSIRIDLQKSGYVLMLTVEDDGVGLGTAGVRSGLGLIGIQERVRALGGTVEITSRPHGGTRLMLRFPVSGATAAAHG